MVRRDSRPYPTDAALLAMDWENASVLFSTDGREWSSHPMHDEVRDAIPNVWIAEGATSLFLVHVRETVSGYRLVSPGASSE